MNQVHQEYKERGLVVYAINIEEKPETVAAFARTQNLTMPVLLDPEGNASRAYRITATPTVFLIGRDGKLVAKALGSKPWTSPQGRALLQRLVAK